MLLERLLMPGGVCETLTVAETGLVLKLTPFEDWLTRYEVVSGEVFVDDATSNDELDLCVAGELGFAIRDKDSVALSLKVRILDTLKYEGVTEVCAFDFNDVLVLRPLVVAVAKELVCPRVVPVFLVCILVVAITVLLDRPGAVDALPVLTVVCELNCTRVDPVLLL